MNELYHIAKKVYPSDKMGMLSMLDMLDFFIKRGPMRVSDLHVKVGAAPAYRIDGDMIPINGPALTQEMAHQLIFPLINEQKRVDLNQTSSVDAAYRYKDLQFRINVFQERDGLCAAIRALTMQIPTIADIGFPNTIWQDIINLKTGLVLVTGITGAGKSTTIASMISLISKERRCRIITLEDPVEYLFAQEKSMISQREVGQDVSSFVDGLRSLMRQDPDIIFVGEMRDPETISMTLMAAETGHLVFSTLHTRDATGTITRIMDYFPPERQAEVRNQLSLGLKYIVCQKLVPQKDGNGRIVAMEILNNNYACANLIRTGKIEQLYSQLQSRIRDRPDEKMITMESHLSQLVRQNRLDMLEAQKWANNPIAFADLMRKINDSH